jgi:hypothetical protein
MQAVLPFPAEIKWKRGNIYDNAPFFLDHKLSEMRRILWLMELRYKYLRKSKNEIDRQYGGLVNGFESLAKEFIENRYCPKDIKKDLSTKVLLAKQSKVYLWKQVNRKIIDGYRARLDELSKKAAVPQKPCLMRK